jgi:hypothetical protein
MVWSRGRFSLRAETQADLRRREGSQFITALIASAKQRRAEGGQSLPTIREESLKISPFQHYVQNNKSGIGYEIKTTRLAHQNIATMAVLWIRIRWNPKLLAGSGSGLFQIRVAPDPKYFGSKTALKN